MERKTNTIQCTVEDREFLKKLSAATGKKQYAVVSDIIDFYITNKPYTPNGNPKGTKEQG